jgi:hypothetical protein
MSDASAIREESAAERVRAAIAKGASPSRRDLEHALRESLGLSARQAKRFSAVGARAFGEESASDELISRLAALEAVIAGKKNDL